ncbi:uroporphyrinogen-III C-methyltransferase [Piscinibacter koreensis]|uniref:uroporphyrinogen-III C-methyltransferase n=1 Tax=Piscinibacter koreensis TaxID=2742824 RepID=A0A7Y6NL02_9BURK|nr:uroporphyrinogen-III C-methyltransferase [Schlegelella koreensis]
MGRVIFIGAGPGEADLITLRGARRLAEADVVLHDALTDQALRALAPQARWIDVGKRGLTGRHCAPPGAGAVDTGQDTINALLVKHAQSAGVVVRLKGGDPSIFGRLEEELAAVTSVGIECEVVPGVTAALAAAAATRRPLTRRGVGRSVSLATAMTHDRGLVASRGADTQVFYMAGRQLAALSRRLTAAGWPADTPACVVSRAGWPDQLQSDHTVESLGQATVLHAGRPTVVTVGAGAALVSASPGSTASEPEDEARALSTGCRADTAAPAQASAGTDGAPGESTDPAAPDCACTGLADVAPPPIQPKP